MTITTESVNAKEPIFWLPNGCPSWCNFSDSHKAEDDPDDRSHMGTERSVGLSLEPVDRHGYQKEIEMFLYEHVTDAEATIRFGAGDWKNAVSMTMAEARSLANTLLAMCKDAS